MKPKNIGLALSGGGIRAMIFHLGLFQWLAENNLLENIKRISSVSGASLCVGMIYSHNNLQWPTSEEFLAITMPTIKTALQKDLQASAIIKLLHSPTYWGRKVNVIAKVLERKWGVRGKLPQLIGDAMWYVNCTTYETGKRFRFCRSNMGDYQIGYVENPDISLSEVMAASAGFPILIGPYKLDAGRYTWTPSHFSSKEWQVPRDKTLHLWDGGVYDNLGIESVFKPNDGGTLSDGVEFLIVSNASAPIGLQGRKKGSSVKALKRIVDISADQVSAVRTRGVMDFIKRTEQGIYVKIGKSANDIANESNCPNELKAQLVEQCLSSEQVKIALNYPTTLRKPSESDFQILFRHGYETANNTYRCYHG